MIAKREAPRSDCKLCQEMRQAKRLAIWSLPAVLCRMVTAMCFLRVATEKRIFSKKTVNEPLTLLKTTCQRYPRVWALPKGKKCGKLHSLNSTHWLYEYWPLEDRLLVWAVQSLSALLHPCGMDQRSEVQFCLCWKKNCLFDLTFP